MTILFCLGIGLLPSSSPCEPRVISLATLNWKPYVSEGMPGGGLTTEIVRQAFQGAGYEVEVTFMPWIRVLSEVKKGTFDAMYPAYFSKSRSRVYALSSPIANGPLVFCKRSDRRLGYRTLEDLRAYRIGVVRGYVNTPEFDAADFLDKEMVNSDKQNLLKVLTGRIDLAVIDKYTARQIIDSSIPQAQGKLDFMQPPLEVKPLHVGFSRECRGYRRLLDAFNRSLEAMERKGVLQQIHTRHGFRPYPASSGAGNAEALPPS